MNKTITVEDIAQLFKIALTGDEKLQKSAIKLLALLPLYFGRSKQMQKPEAVNIATAEGIFKKKEAYET